jgi:hypothetical protein
MLGFVAEYLPKTGAVGLNLMGGAGMFAVSIYTMFMGKHYDEILAEKLPAGASLEEYIKADPASEMGQALTAARSAAGPDVLNTTLTIPVILVVAFAFLYFYMRGKSKPSLSQA